MRRVGLVEPVEVKKPEQKPAPVLTDKKAESTPSEKPAVDKKKK